MTSQAEPSNALKTWELENAVSVVSDQDALYRYDHEDQKAIQAAKPWARDPHYFKRSVTPSGVPQGGPWDRRCSLTLCRGAAATRAHPPVRLPPAPPACSVRISALALLKMAMHAKSGGNLEVMGVMQVVSE